MIKIIFSQMKYRKAAYTLVELLVVIVIIGILATIAVGAYSGYFEKARDAERKWHFNALEKAFLQKYLFEGTYRALGTGWNDGGHGWLNYGAGTGRVYEDSIISDLIDKNYLSLEYKDRLQGDFGYMFYTCDCVGAKCNGFSLSATREDLPENQVDINGRIYTLEGTLRSPSQNDIDNVYSLVCMGAPAYNNSIFSRYGKNQVISHRE